MSDCLYLVSTDAKMSDVCNWSQVSQLTHVLHCESVTITSAASGYLEIEPFCVPSLDCRVVGYLIYGCCDTGAIHSFTDERICHVHQNGDDTCVKLDCWELNGKQLGADAEVCWTNDPCRRAHELRCCMMDWAKNGRKTSFSFRDSSGSTSFLPIGSLKELLSQAETECDAMNCVNSRCISYRCDNGYC